MQTDPMRDPMPDLTDAIDLCPDTRRISVAMAELIDFAIDELCRSGYALPEARRAGAKVVVRLCQEVGGARYYWPRGDATMRAVRNLEIWAAHDGTTSGVNGIVALARRYQMSDAQVRRIIAAERELHRKRSGVAGATPDVKPPKGG